MEKKLKDKLEKIAEKYLDEIEKHPIKSLIFAGASAWILKKMIKD